MSARVWQTNNPALQAWNALLPFSTEGLWIVLPILLFFVHVDSFYPFFRSLQLYPFSGLQRSGAHPPTQRRLLLIPPPPNLNINVSCIRIQSVERRHTDAQSGSPGDTETSGHHFSGIPELVGSVLC